MYLIMLFWHQQITHLAFILLHGNNRCLFLFYLNSDIILLYVNNHSFFPFYLNWEITLISCFLFTVQVSFLPKTCANTGFSFICAIDYPTTSASVQFCWLIWHFLGRVEPAHLSVNLQAMVPAGWLRWWPYQEYTCVLFYREIMPTRWCLMRS